MGDIGCCGRNIWHPHIGLIIPSHPTADTPSADSMHRHVRHIILNKY